MYQRSGRQLGQRQNTLQLQTLFGLEKFIGAFLTNISGPAPPESANVHDLRDFLAEPQHGGNEFASFDAGQHREQAPKIPCFDVQVSLQRVELGSSWRNLRKLTTIEEDSSLSLRDLHLVSRLDK